jgi:homoserine O-acetyltransferase
VATVWGQRSGTTLAVIGPGKAIDTDKLFAVALNMLGWSFGSTNTPHISTQ